MPRTFSRFACLPLLLAPSVAAGRSLLTQRMRIGYEQASLDMHESNSTELKNTPDWCKPIFFHAYTHKFALQRNGARTSHKRYIQILPSKEAARNKPELYVWPSSYADGGTFKQKHCGPSDFRYRVKFDPLKHITIQRKPKEGWIFNDDGQVVFHGAPDPNSGDINRHRLKKDGRTFQALSEKKIEADESITSITVNVPHGDMWKQMRHCILNLQFEFSQVDDKAMEFVIGHFRKSPTSFTKDNLLEMILFMITEGLLPKYELFTGFLRPMLYPLVKNAYATESLAFLDALVVLDSSTTDLQYNTKALEIYAKFIQVNAPDPVNIAAATVTEIANKPQYGLEGKTVTNLPNDLRSRNVFSRAKQDVLDTYFEQNVLKNIKTYARGYARNRIESTSNDAKVPLVISEATKAVFDSFQGGPNLAEVTPERMIKLLRHDQTLMLPAAIWKSLAEKVAISMEAEINAS